MQEIPGASNAEVSKVVQPPTTAARVVWVEYLAILGAFAVVWLHVSSGVVLNAADSYTWWVGNISISLVQWPVPIFVMVGGYFMLDPNKNYTLVSFYKKRASRLIAPLVFWSLFYVAFHTAQRYAFNEPTTLRNIIGPILVGRPSFHLWYLYMLVGLYLVTPFLRKIVSSSSQRELVFFCVMWFLFAMFVGMANYFYFGIYDSMTNGSTFITWFLEYIGYFVAGYLLVRSDKIKLGLIALIGIFCGTIIITAIGCYFLTQRYSFNVGQFFDSMSNPFIVIMSISIFLIAKKLLIKVPKIKFLEGISTSALGVYVMHPFFIICLGYLGFDALNFNPVLGIPLVMVCVFLICLILSEVIKRIPYFNKVI